MILNAKNVNEYGLVYDENVKAYVYGAEQLKKYVKKSSGLELGDYNQNAHFISIGYNEKSKDLIDAADKSTLKTSGLRIVFKDGNVYIYSKSDVGTIYGAFEFCERYLGVRFLTNTDEYIPTLQSVEIPETDVECNPCFDQREVLHFSAMVNPDYVLKRRFEGPNMPNHEGAGVINSTWYNKISNSHNSLCYVSKEKYYETHPEMFNTPDPSRASEYKSETEGEALFLECCYSNGVTDDGKLDESLEVSTVKAVAESLYNFIKEDTRYKYFMFGRQDNEGAICYCPKCVAKRKRYGGEAGTMIMFFNVVIDLVEKMLLADGITPDFNVVTFAYQSTFQAPVDESFKPIDDLIIPHERLHIRSAPHHKNMSYSVMDERQYENMKTSIKGWSAITKNLMMWDYPVDYMDSLFFAPSYLHLAEDVALYNEIGVSYMMYEEAFNSTQWYNIEMDSYIMSKLYWNPNQSVYALMKEYIDGYYGVAAEAVYEFRCKMLKFFEKKVNEKDGFEVNPVNPWSAILQPETYPLEFLADCVKGLEDGFSTIESSNLSLAEKNRQKKRLSRVLLSPLRMILRNKEYYFGDEHTDYEDRFNEIVEKTGYLMQYTPVDVMEANVPNYKLMVDKSNAQTVECAEYINEWIKNKTNVALEIVDCNEFYPTYSVKVISLGAHKFSKEFFKRTDFDKYNIFVKNCGYSVFLAGKDLKGSCEIFIDKLKERTWCKGATGRFTNLTYGYYDIIEYLK